MTHPITHPSTRTVLIVDDSLTVRMDLAEAFEAAGFRALPCSTAAEARAALSRGNIALAVLDVLLPDGDGVELLREIRMSPVTVRVLMLSTESEVKSRVRALQIGADDYVGKPYDVNFVVARARELLSDRAAPPIARAVVLVIDDSPTYREEVRLTLEAAGYAVLLAASGEEGLRVAAASRPSAVLVDGVLPGMDGPTVIRKIRLDAALRTTACMLLTGSEDRESELRALDAGADSFVRKEEEFEVILARLQAVLRAATAERTETASLFGPKRILAVDDSATFLGALAELLRGQGYEVVLARSGEEAIEMLGIQPVDCILLDLVMPGLGGKETLRRIKQSPAVCDVPLILLTALDDRRSMLEGLSLGADDYIAKSSEFDVLSVRVRAQLRRKQVEDEHRRVREQLLRSEVLAADERAARQVAEARAAFVIELEQKNKELEAFSYSVSHDLRSPLRAMDGFSQALLEDYGDRLDERARDYLGRVRAGARRMGELIEDLIKLSRAGSGELNRQQVDLSSIVEAVCADLRQAGADRDVAFAIQPQVLANADSRLMRVMFENLLGNAWKFTGKTAAAIIEFGIGAQDVYFVRDNGAGFDPGFVQTLFAPFRRLHREDEFTGTGIGLATVRRIVERHGGRVWAQGEIDRGATISFTLPLARSASRSSSVRRREGAAVAASVEGIAGYPGQDAGGLGRGSEG
jgi:DNA-binding response OmpR family regulator